MKFADINYDLSILDKYLSLSDQKLVMNFNTGRLDVWSIPFNEYRFEDVCAFGDMIECVIDLAYDLFKYNYDCFDDEDYARQSTYLQHLQLARYWLESFKKGEL